jgi:DNA repair protein RadC
MDALSTTELIQLVTCVRYLEQAHEVYQAADCSLANLDRMSIEEIAETPGMGETLARCLKASLELGRRLSLERDDDLHQVRSPADAANFVMPMLATKDQEHFMVLMMDTKNRILQAQTLYIGNVNTQIIRVAEVFKQAIKRNAPSIILAHNHPSGDPMPSPEDIRCTERIVEAGRLMDIDVLDHIVVGRNRFVSLKQRGLGFN